MSRYLLARAAESDLDSIWEDMARDGMDAADRWVAKLFEAFEALAAYPAIGHTRRPHGPPGIVLARGSYPRPRGLQF